MESGYHVLLVFAEVREQTMATEPTHTGRVLTPKHAAAPYFDMLAKVAVPARSCTVSTQHRGEHRTRGQLCTRTMQATHLWWEAPDSSSCAARFGAVVTVALLAAAMVCLVQMATQHGLIQRTLQGNRGGARSLSRGA